MKTQHVATNPVQVEITHRVLSEYGTIVSIHDRLSDAQSMRDTLSKKRGGLEPMKGLRIQEWHEGGWRDVADPAHPEAP